MSGARDAGGPAVDDPALSSEPAAAPGPASGEFAVVALMAAAGVGYYVAARLSLLLQNEETGVAVFWPASGLAAGLILALGAWSRWPTAAAVALATVLANLERGLPLQVAGVFGISNALECALLSCLLSAAFGPRFQLDSLMRVFGFVAATAFATGVAALPAVLVLKLGIGVEAPLADLWRVWLTSDALGIIVVAPLLIALPHEIEGRLPPARVAEGLLVLALLAATALYEFSHLGRGGFGQLSLGLIFPLVLWLAARGSPAFAATGAFAVAVAVVYYVTRGARPFGELDQPLPERIAIAQVAMLSLSLCTLSLSALITGLDKTAAALRAQEKRLSIATRAAGLGVFELRLQGAVVWENERMYEIFGHGRSDGAVSLSDFRDKYLDPSQRDSYDQSFPRVIDEGEGHSVYRIRRKDGVWRDLEIISVVEKAADGKPERIVGVIADITERRQTEERQGLLMGELDHRVKNALETVLLLLAMTRSTASDVTSFADALTERIHAMARAHQLLGREHWSGVDLEALVAGQLEPYAAPGRIGFTGPKVRLKARATESLSMVLHELATNAAKHGALSNETGRVDVDWRKDGEMLVIDWRERGGPPVAPGCRVGYGSRLIRESLKYELQGRVDLHLDPNGVRCEIAVPLERVTAR